MNPVGSNEEEVDEASVVVATSATESATSEAVDRTASAASEIRSEKSLTDNFCAVVRDNEDDVLTTGAKAEQVVAAEANKMQRRREFAIDDFMMIIVAVL